MSSALTNKTFDYSIFDKDTKSDLIYFAGQILGARDVAAKSVIAMGEALAAAQERLANHSGGVFIQWVETECGFSKGTAYNLIYAYREFGSFPNFGKLEDSAAYALASPATPKKARLEAMKLADKGQSITHAKAKEIIAKYKQQESSSDKGKPGGAHVSSSNESPVADGPVSSATAAETEVETDSEEEAADPTEETEKTPGKKRVSVEKIVDNLVKAHVGHIARGLSEIAEANGGEGEQFSLADAGLNQLIESLQEMRKGVQ